MTTHKDSTDIYPAITSISDTDVPNVEFAMNPIAYHSIDDLPMVLCVEALMPILGVGRNKAYELVRSGQIRSIKVGRRYLIPRNAIAEFLATPIPVI